MKKLQNIAIFDYNSDTNILFHYPTFSVVKIDITKLPIIDYMQGKRTYKEVLSKGISIQEIDSFIESIPDSFFEQEIPFNPTSNTLGRLTILASSACNLNCKYCYAVEGSFNYPSSNMPIEIANRTINYFLSKYDGVERIMFFGGEALLNIDVIEFVVKKFESLVISGEVENEPHYSLVTNGTILNDRILNIIKEYNFGVSVSIDGDKNINDSLRIYKNGKGTFNTIIKNLKVLSENLPEESLCYECTFSDVHEKNGLEAKDVKDIIERETGIKNGVILPVQGIRENNKYVPNYKVGDESYKRLQNEYWERLIKGEPVYNNELRIMFSRFLNENISSQICSIGSEAFTIAPNGDIYPCYLLADNKNKDFFIGNITDNDLEEKIAKEEKKLDFLRKDKKEECSSCYAVGLCGFCPAIEILNNNYKLPVNYNYFCNRTREQVKDFIIKITKIRDNRENWEKLQESLELMFN